MLERLRECWQFCRRPTSDNAAILIIGLASYLDLKDLKQMAEYLAAVRENRIKSEKAAGLETAH